MLKSLQRENLRMAKELKERKLSVILQFTASDPLISCKFFLNLQYLIYDYTFTFLFFLKKNLFQWKPYFIFVPSNFTDDSDASDDKESETGSDIATSGARTAAYPSRAHEFTTTV
jgi:hypothetical protein